MELAKFSQAILHDAIKTGKQSMPITFGNLLS